MASKAELLKGVSLFSHCSKRDLRSVASSMKEVEHPAGRIIVSEGDSGVGFFLIVDGTVKVSVKGRTRRKMGPGEYFGEIALITGGARTATVTAESPVTLYGITSWEFRQLLKQQPAMALKVMETIAERLADAEKVID